MFDSSLRHQWNQVSQPHRGWLFFGQLEIGAGGGNHKPGFSPHEIEVFKGVYFQMPPKIPQIVIEGVSSKAVSRPVKAPLSANESKFSYHR